MRCRINNLSYICEELYQNRAYGKSFASNDYLKSLHTTSNIHDNIVNTSNMNIIAIEMFAPKALPTTSFFAAVCFNFATQTQDTQQRASIIYYISSSSDTKLSMVLYFATINHLRLSCSDLASH